MRCMRDINIKKSNIYIEMLYIQFSLFRRYACFPYLQYFRCWKVLTKILYILYKNFLMKNSI